MKRILIARPAERDLDSIKRHLAEKAGVGIAHRVMKDIRTAMPLLAD